jgi:hypothetical protein
MQLKGFDAVAQFSLIVSTHVKRTKKCTKHKQKHLVFLCDRQPGQLIRYSD